MTTTLLDALERLQTALDALARALTTGDADAVLSAEAPVATAMSALGAIRRKDADLSDGDRLRRAIMGVRLTLARCQALGHSAEAYARTLFPETAYGRHGLRLVPIAPSRRARPVT